MPAKVHIKDASGKGSSAGVTKRGELIVAPLDYSSPYNASLSIINTPYEIVPGKIGKKFVTTGFFISALKDVSNTIEASISVYEASPLDLATSLVDIVTVDLIRGQRFIATGTNIITQTGTTITATTDDATVNVALSGYYVDA